MRAAAVIAVLLASSLAAPAFAKPHFYRSGVVEKVVFRERPGTLQIELSDKATGPAGPGFVYLTVRSGSITYTATFYAYNPGDYPLSLRPGEVVGYRISQERYIECDIHAVMRMRWVTQLTLRDQEGKTWPLEIGPAAPPELPAASIPGLSSRK